MLRALLDYMSDFPKMSIHALLSRKVNKKKNILVYVIIIIMTYAHCAHKVQRWRHRGVILRATVRIAFQSNAIVVVSLSTH